MEAQINVEILILVLLLISSVVAIAVRRFRIPYTVGLVLAGLALSFRSPIEIALDPNLFLLFFIPPLLFDAAFHLNISDLRSNLRTIALLAVPGVILSTLLVGGVVSVGAGLPIEIALVFGALIAATDPVAVVAIFRKLGAPKRLTVLLEGESLFNDGTAIVIFELALASIYTGDFNLFEGLLDFVLVSGGGIAIGLALGWLFSLLVARINDHLVETTLTTVLAFGSFLVAEEFMHVSGVLAVVTAGLVAGNVGPRGMSPTTRIAIDNFWEYTAYLANSVVFLLIGFQIDLQQVVSNWFPILWAIAAVLASRAIVIYLGSGLQGRIPVNWRHVLFWGGLRGGIALALALSLPFSLGRARGEVIAMAFGVVLFTLLAQGTTMGWVIARLRVVFRSEDQLEYERRHARAIAARAGYDHLKELRDAGLISSHTWESIRPLLRKRVDSLTEAVQETLHNAPELEIDELINARRRELRAQRMMIGDLRHEGVVSDEAHAELVVEIDTALQTGVETWAQRILADHLALHIHEIMFVVVSARDLENVSSSLATQGIPATQIASSGGFLKKKNFTLVLGIPEGKLELAVQTMQRSTRGNIEYLEGSSDEVTLMPGPGIPVHVRGATVFIFDVEAFEEILS